MAGPGADAHKDLRRGAGGPCSNSQEGREGHWEQSGLRSVKILASSGRQSSQLSCNALTSPLSICVPCFAAASMASEDEDFCSTCLEGYTLGTGSTSLASPVVHQPVSRPACVLLWCAHSRKVHAMVSIERVPLQRTPRSGPSATTTSTWPASMSGWSASRPAPSATRP